MGTYKFTMSVLELVTYEYTFKVEAESEEEAAEKLEEDYYRYEVASEHVDGDHYETLWDTLDCFEKPKIKPILDLSDIDGMAQDDVQFELVNFTQDL